MNITKRFALILVVLVACVGCDQTTKFMAQSYLPTTESWSFVGDTLRLQLTHNAGAFLGIGDSMPASWRYTVFNLGGTILLICVLGYALFARRLHPVGVFAIALFFAGGVSNLIDRWVYGGYVVDFINIGIGPIRTGIFNVADMFVMLGAFILLFSGVQAKRFLTFCLRRKR